MMIYHYSVHVIIIIIIRIIIMITTKAVLSREPFGCIIHGLYLFCDISSIRYIKQANILNV